MARRKMGAVLCLAAALVMMGCQGGGKTQETAGAAQGQIGNEEKEQKENGIMGKVTAVSGNEITLELVEMPRMGEGGPGGASGERPELKEGETMPEPPEGQGEGKTPPERPEGETMAEGETPPERPESGTMEEGQTPPGGARGELKSTGEEQTITVSDKTVYTTDEMGEQKEASAADVEEGVFIRVEMDGDTVASVTIMKMGQRD